MSKFVFPRYIKREDAQKVLCGWCGVCPNPTLEDLEKCDDICPQFSQIPNGDVRPVVRGKWSRVYDDFMKSNYDTCSCCGKEYFGANGFNFCPNCGADMRGGDGNG